ncbi:hypothetical protein G6705_08975, partial [Polynucleobacter paneuropaeus]|nr:hypothetical protein [Polynucleobacter paneuropaeus]
STDLTTNYTITLNAKSGDATTGTPTTKTDNTVTLSKAALGINLNATYNGTTSYDNGIQTNGLQVNDSIASVTINNANVAANGTNYIKSVTGTTGGNSSTDLTTNYTITLNAKSGDATTGTPTTKTDNTVTLSKAALAITVSNAAYNGTKNFTKDNATINVAGMVNSETLAVTGVSTNSANVVDNGTNYVTSITSIDASSKALLSNYAINPGYLAANAPLTAGATAATSPNSVTLTPISVTISGSKTYDGNTAFAISNGCCGSTTLTVTNAILGDTVGIATGGSGSVSSPNVAAGSQTLSLGTLALSNNSGGNYTLVGGSGTAIITPANLTLIGSQIYNGGTAVSGASLTARGVAGETFAVSGSGDSSNLSSANVQTASTLSTITGLTLGTSSNGGLAGNYNALSAACSTVNVTPAPLGIAVNAVYQGTGRTINGSGNISLFGLQGNDAFGGASSVTLNSSGNVLGSSSNYVSSITPMGGWLLSNYVLNTAVTANGNNPGTTGGSTTNTGGTNYVNITPAPLAIAVSGSYNGSKTFSSSNANIQVAGLVGGETLTVTGVNTSSANVIDNGSNYVTAITTIAANSTASLSNYVINSGYAPVSGALTAGSAGNNSPNAVTLSAANLSLNIAASKTYDGTSSFYVNPGSLDSNFTYILSGMVGGDVAPTITGGSAAVSSANAGTYTSFKSNTLALSDPNYTLTGGSVSAFINKAPLTVIGVNNSYAYNGAEQTNIGAQVYGAVGSESITVNPGAYAKVTNVAMGTKKDGVYTLSYTDGANSNNYVVTFVSKGSLTITPAQIVLTGTSNTVTYTGSTQTNTGASVTINGNAATLNGSSISGLAGDTLTLTGYGSGSDAGTYKDTLGVSGLTPTSNYAVSKVNNGQLTISPENVTVNLFATKVYDGSTSFAITGTATSYTNYIANFTYTLSGATGGSVYLLSGSTNTTSANVGSYIVSTSGFALSSTNYTLSGTGSATINPAPLGVALYGTYNGSKSFSAGTNLTANTTSSAIASDSLTGNFIKVVGLQGSDAVSGATINNQNVAGNGTNSVTALTGIGSFASSSTDRSAGNYYVASSNYNATGGTFSSINTAITPIAGTTNAVVINPAKVSITGTDNTATYTGNQQTNTGATVTGAVNGETVTVTGGYAKAT